MRGALLLKALGVLVLVLVGDVVSAGVRENQALPPAWAGRVARWKPPDSGFDSLIADLLKGKSRDVRVRAAEALGGSRDSRALDALLAALKDSDRSVRQAVANALGELRDPKAIAPLLQAAVEDRDRDVRESAGEAISRFPERALADASSDALRQLGPRARQAAAPILGGPLRRALTDADSDVRAAAAEALGEMRDEGSVAALERALEDRSRRVRNAADDALRRIGKRSPAPSPGEAARKSPAEPQRPASGTPAPAPARVPAVREPPPPTPEKLLADLEGPDVRTRETALNVLAALLPSARQDLRGQVVRVLRGQADFAVPLLISALEAPLKERRPGAAFALGEIGDPRAAGALVAALSDPDLWTEAGSALRKLGAAGEDALVAALQAGNPRLARGVIDAVGPTRDPRALDPLVLLLKEPARGPDLRRAAAAALGKLGLPKGADPLIAAIADPDAGVRTAAASSLGALGAAGGPAAVSALVAALDDESESVREAATEALGALRDPAVSPALANALWDSAAGTRRAARTGLDALGWKPSTMPEIVAYRVAGLEWGEIARLGKPARGAFLAAMPGFGGGSGSGLWRDYARTLEAVGGWDVSAVVREALKSPDAGTRSAAALILGYLKDEAAVAPLVAALLDGAQGVRRSARQALETLHWTPGTSQEAVAYRIAGGEEQGVEEFGRAAVQPLSLLLRGAQDAESRARAAAAIGRIHDPAGVGPLIEALADRSELVRAAAARALAALEDPRAMEPLISLLADSSPDVRETAVGALSILTGERLGSDAAAWREWWGKNRQKYVVVP